jgi:glycosyltransferase involved in cell wall biosynthesis
MAKPVSIIIAFYNKIDLLRLFLAALEQQTYKEFEVVIADDGSKPEVVEEINALKNSYFFPIKHIWQEDNGWQKEKILNKAVVIAEGEYLIFMDGDCIAHPKFVMEHVENRAPNQVLSGRRIELTEKVSKKLTLENIQKGNLHRLVAFPLLVESFLFGRRTQYGHLLRIRNRKLRKVLVKDKVRTILGCNFSMWKKDLLKVNGFDERYIYPGYGEDTDLDDRLRRIGIYPISKKHMVTVYHIYHPHTDTDHEPNIRLWNGKKETNEVFTPYGIVKEEKTD